MDYKEIYILGIELIIILATLIISSVFAKREPKESRKAFAISFVLLMGVCIAFCIVQLFSIFKIVNITMSYTPFEILSLISVVYWFGFILKKSSLFDKITG